MSQLKTFILEEDLKSLRSVSVDDFLTSKIEIYGSAFLFALRQGKVEAAKIIWEKVSLKNPALCKKLKSSRDNTSEKRNALTLAVLSDNPEAVLFVHTVLKLPLSAQGSDDSPLFVAMQRNTSQSFLTLLKIGAIFSTVEYKKSQVSPEFKKYFEGFDAFIDLCSTGNISVTRFYMQKIHHLDINQRSDFFKTTFSRGLAEAKKNKHNAQLTFLLNLHFVQQEFSKADPDTLVTYFDYMNLDSKVVRNSATNNLSIPSPTKIKQQGRLSIKSAKKETPRKPHSFSSNRERQTLRHIATQLYFALEDYQEKNKKKGELKEIQCLHLFANGKSNLIICANECSANDDLVSMIKEGKFRKHLLTSHQADSKEGKTRSHRFSKKLFQRVFAPTQMLYAVNPNDDFSYTTRVKATVRKESIHIVPVELIAQKIGSANNGYALDKKSRDKISEILTKGDQIIVLQTKIQTYDKRHAEEYLCDIADLVTAEDKHTCIAGKKRPCVGCSGRLEESKIDNYGKYPGRIFVNTTERQKVSVVKRSLFTLLQKPSYITQDSKGHDHTDFDSESNTDVSDLEDDESTETCSL